MAYRTMDGRIAQVQLFNRVITAAEITDIMNRPGSVTSGLIGYWKMKRNESPEPDYSGNGNVGAVTDANPSSDDPAVGSRGRVLTRAYGVMS